MLRKIYQELVLIRKELQAIRGSWELVFDIERISSKIDKELGKNIVNRQRH